ncbi:hypothetical protein SANT12839_037260 [Streptomyces antimycoticus]|uniref:Uncharacterized protein n=1 Tax=Streptomyces antimycoticus TaxID=68175 RepID=A0A4D4K415_9ACTN|nr:hypothetical protein SANT12839_037260 [Streptomyces antimycoticus]
MAREKPTSVRRSSGWASRWARRFAAWARSAGRLLAATVHSGSAAARTSAGAPSSAVFAVCGSSASGSGACSRMVCALVPLMPNEDTAARRGWSVSGQARPSVSSETAPADQSTLGVGWSTCRVRGSVPWRIAMTILMMPATPAAAWVWPMLDLMEPSHSGWSSVWLRPYVASRACASMGSPRVVPVPWASTTSICPAESRAEARAWRMTRCCEGPFGAVRPLLAPSWLMALPRTRASTWWPLARASESRSSSSMPAPSPQPVPSAAAAKDLQRPSAARPRWRLNSVKVPGVDITVTPPARASEHSRRRSAWAAKCRATKEEEQAVSMVTAGPSRPKV